MKSFAKTVRALRVRAGHASARAFHRGWSGFGVTCSRKAYSEIEAGRLVPSPRVAARLAAELGVRPGTAHAEEFRRAYLFACTRSAGLTRVLHESLAPEAGADAGLAERALGVGMERRTRVLTAGQKRLLLDDAGAMRCFTVLQAVPRSWTPRELAAALGLGASKIGSTLGALAGAGLVRAKDGAWSSPYADGNAVFPRLQRHEIERLARVDTTSLPRASWRRQGVVLFRARDGGARRLARRMAMATSSSTALHRRVAGDTGLFSVRTLVWRLS